VAVVRTARAADFVSAWEHGADGPARCLETLLLAIRRFDGVGWRTIWDNEFLEGVTNG
jgi:hypothetical protein